MAQSMATAEGGAEGDGLGRGHGGSGMGQQPPALGQEARGGGDPGPRARRSGKGESHVAPGETRWVLNRDSLQRKREFGWEVEGRRVALVGLFLPLGCVSIWTDGFRKVPMCYAVSLD